MKIKCCDDDDDVVAIVLKPNILLFKARETVAPGQIQKGETTATMLVLITLQDVNDHAPVFNRPLYSASVLKNAQKGTSIQLDVAELIYVQDQDQARKFVEMLEDQKNTRNSYVIVNLCWLTYSRLHGVNAFHLIKYLVSRRAHEYFSNTALKTFCHHDILIFSMKSLLKKVHNNNL